MRATARVWPTSGSDDHPEQAHPLVAPPRSTGVCISGGSTRSFAAAIGILRGLTVSGLLRHVGYLSAVSGGAWAAVPYTYCRDDAADDAQILGEHEEPEDLVLSRLEHAEPLSLASAATANFAAWLWDGQRDPHVLPEHVWVHAVGRMFLTPFGLFDPELPVGFTLNERVLSNIRSRNPALAGRHFHTVRSASYRPYLLVHSTLSWPRSETDVLRATRVGFEYSPLAAGTLPLRELSAEFDSTMRVGGFVESFAFGGRAVSPCDTSRGEMAVELPSRAFSLADALGASSAFRAPGRDAGTYPSATCWPVGAGGVPIASTQAFTDGGDLDNYGLLALLRRGVGRIVVCINSVWPLSLDYDPSSWPPDIDEVHRTAQPVDSSLAPLFGADSRKFSANRVFPEADFSVVIRGLQSAKRDGRTVMMVSNHTVQTNQSWGIQGGWTVRICWVYNEYVEAWVGRLREPLQGLVRRGHSVQPTGGGPVHRFPHYLTREQNPGELIRLTALQVNLLAHLSSWNVVQNRDTLADCLGAGEVGDPGAP